MAEAFWELLPVIPQLEKQSQKMAQKQEVDFLTRIYSGHFDRRPVLTRDLLGAYVRPNRSKRVFKAPSCLRYPFGNTPGMQLVLQAQFDNISRSLGFSVRYRWEYEPGNEIFVALGQSVLIPGTTFEPQSSQVSVRLAHTLRF